MNRANPRHASRLLLPLVLITVVANSLVATSAQAKWWQRRKPVSIKPITNPRTGKPYKGFLTPYRIRRGGRSHEVVVRGMAGRSSTDVVNAVLFEKGRGQMLVTIGTQSRPVVQMSGACGKSYECTVGGTLDLNGKGMESFTGSLKKELHEETGYRMTSGKRRLFGLLPAKKNFKQVMLTPKGIAYSPHHTTEAGKVLALVKRGNPRADPPAARHFDAAEIDRVTHQPLPLEQVLGALMGQGVDNGRVSNLGYALLASAHKLNMPISRSKLKAAMGQSATDFREATGVEPSRAHLTPAASTETYQGQTLSLRATGLQITKPDGTKVNNPFDIVGIQRKDKYEELPYVTDRRGKVYVVLKDRWLPGAAARSTALGQRRVGGGTDIKAVQRVGAVVDVDASQRGMSLLSLSNSAMGGEHGKLRAAGLTPTNTVHDFKSWRECQGQEMSEVRIGARAFQMGQGSSIGQLRRNLRRQGMVLMPLERAMGFARTKANRMPKMTGMAVFAMGLERGVGFNLKP